MMTTAKRFVRDRGTVMVMVVVVLVLMVMLGAAYMQVVRVQRVADVKQPNNIDTILQSVIAEIKLQLKDDIINVSSTKFFDETTVTDGVEPYDYPSRNASGPTYLVLGLDGSTIGNARGNHLDDVWMSSTVPDFGTNQWPKISNLTGAFYPATGTTAYTRDVASNAADTSPGTNHWIITTGGEDENQNLTSGQLVDTDGDGIGDSRWERAPIPLMTGTEYFMAVRVIDLSSLVNLRTATIATTDGNDGSVTSGEVTGFFPSGIDLSRLLGRKGANWSSGSASLFSNATYGFGRSGIGGTQFPLGFATAGMAEYINDFYESAYDATLPTGTPAYGAGQLYAWRWGGRVYGQLIYAAEPTLELHYRGGLNDPDRTTGYETALGNSAAADPLEEGYNHANDPVVTSAQNHFVGTDTANLYANSLAADIRHMTTTVSGHKLFAPNQGDMHSGAHTLKIDLNTGINGSGVTSQQRFDAIQPRLETIFTLAPTYSGMSGSPATAAAEFAASIAEYSDEDGELSVEHTIGGTSYYGIEALPFLAEAYLQVGYRNTSGTPGAVEDWAPVADSQGVVVEIRNPFDRPIQIGKTTDPKGPRIRIAIFEGTNATPISSIELPSRTLEPRDSTTPPPVTGVEYPNAAKHVYVSNGNASPTVTEDSATDNVVEGASALNIPAAVTTVLGNNVLMFNANSQQIIIALQTLRPGAAGTSDTDWVTYDRLTETSLSFASTVPFASGTPPLVKTEAFVQRSIKRDGRYIRCMSNAGKTATSREPTGGAPDGVTAWPTVPVYDGGIDKFGTDAKLSSIPAALMELDSVQFPVANRPIFSLGELTYISMLGFNSSDTGDLPQRLDDPTGTKHKNYWTMVFGTGAGPSDDTRMIATAAGIGYNYLILDQFTVLHPGWDGVDNDDNDSDDNTMTGNDDASEQTNPFVMGTINVNTAPKHILAYALPVPLGIGINDTTALTSQWLADGIVTNRPYGSMGRVAELVYGVAATQAGAAWDFYPMLEETQTAANGGQSAVQYANEIFNNSTSMPEHNARLFQFLPQALSTRSDIYMAHIFVKGYKSGQIGQDLSVESGRAIAIFSRAKVASNTDEVELIGVYFY